MTLRVCLEDGCGVLVDSGRCATHQRQTDHARTTAQRGYGAAHQRERRVWQQFIDDPDVDVLCWRCTLPITPGQAWDLGHDDDRTWTGPQHAACNRDTQPEW